MAQKTTAELLESFYGIRTLDHLNREVASVEITVTKILANDPGRISFVITNNGTSIIYILPRNNVSPTLGIAVAPNGGAVATDYTTDGEMVCREWWAIAVGASSAVTIMETVIARSLK